MARKLIDISVPLQNDVPADPPGLHPAIQYHDHQQSLPRMLGFFEGLKAEDLPDGQGWAMETVQLSTHNGTHLDAPYHYHPTMNRGERSWTIDEVPLEWCLQPGIKLDFRHFPDGYVATAADVEAELKRIGHTLSPLEIVVVNTTRPAATSAIATSKRCTIWSFCPRPASPCPAFRSRSSAPPPAGRGRSRLSTREAAGRRNACQRVQPDRCTWILRKRRAADRRTPNRFRQLMDSPGLDQLL